MASLYETMGHTFWVEVRKTVKAPAMPRVNTKPSGHKIGDCIRMTACPIHASAWKAHSKEYRAAHRADHPLPPRKVGAR